MKQYLYFLVFFICCTSCKSDDKASPSILETTIHSIDEKKERINTIKFYLENSASMAGYFSKRTEFSDNIDNILTLLNASNNFKGKLETYTICDSINRYEELSRFQSALRLEPGNQISIGKSSKLDNILSAIYQKTEKGQISMLVTDGIMSGSDAEMKQYFKKHNLHFNIQQKNALKNQIFQVVDERKEAYFVIISAFQSSFNGVYYALDNSKKSGEFQNRPYYLITIGHKDLFEEYYTKVLDIVKPEKEIALGIDYKSINFFPTSYSPESKNVEIDTQTGKIKFKKNRKDFKIPLLANFSLLLKQENNATLKERIKVSSKEMDLDSDIEIYNLDDRNTPLLKSSDPNLRKLIDANSHLVVLSINNYTPSKDKDFTISITETQENWYNEWSCTNDFNIDFSFDKTLNLTNFIGGFLQAYQDKSIYKQSLILQ